MEAPEKIYLVIDPIWGSMSVNYNRNDTNNIEYIRKDAFIEKACAYFRTLDDKEPPYETTEEFIKGFIKAMEQ